MVKTTTAVMLAAAVAAAVTILPAPAAHVNASALPKEAAAPVAACAQRAWPYLRCVGTAYGNPRIRLVTTDRLN